jgi:phenylpyruvate tautomerase PptA (4-oxalocrotonate tautomerase family)
MPLVRVSLRQGQPPSYLAAIGESIHQAMIETINVPRDDRFQIMTEHSADRLVYGPSYLGIARTDRVLIIQITLNLGRTLDQKKALYRTIADKLEREPGIRKEDVFINLVEVAKENWSFGNGIASYAT